MIILFLIFAALSTAMLSEAQINALYISLGQNVRKHREARGYKQTNLAELLRISRASLVNIEKGRQRPPLHFLFQLAELLQIPARELIPDLQQQEDSVVVSKIEKQIEIDSEGDSAVKERLLEFIKKQAIRNI